MKNIVMAALLSATVLSASATVINFDGASGSTTLPPQNAMAYTEAGYRLVSSLGDAEYHNDIFQPMAGMNTNGSAVIGWCGSYCGGDKTITLTGPGLFSLVSIDFASLVSGSGSGMLTVTGFLAGGGSVSQSLSYGDNWASTLFVGFDLLTRAEIFSGDLVDVGMDNLVLSAAQVPEPGSLSLVALAMLALGAAVNRRKR